MKKQKKKKKLKKKRIRNNQKRKQMKNNNKSYNGLKDNLFNGKSYESISRMAHFDTINPKNRTKESEDTIPKATSNDIKIMKGKMRKSLFSDELIKRYCDSTNSLFLGRYGCNPTNITF